MKPIRKPSQKEQRLLELLVDGSENLNLPSNWKDDLLVQTMDDGGMGSLLLFPNGFVAEKRLFGKEVSRYQFVDADGVDVIVSLYTDKSGKLFEIDSWKVDFSPLIRIPDDI